MIKTLFTNLNHEPIKFKKKLDKVNRLIEEKKIKNMEVVCSIDCWGPDLEYVRYGLNLDWAEKNIETLSMLKLNYLECLVQT